MPDRHRRSKHLRPTRPLAGSHGRRDRKRDGDWAVRTVAGSSAIKDYRCPGCDQLIRPGTPHVVAWPAEPRLGGESAVEDRRHWHNSCWSRRR